MRCMGYMYTPRVSGSEHVADVTHECPIYGSGIDPSSLCLDLEPSSVILFENSQQPIVGMLSYTPVANVCVTTPTRPDSGRSETESTERECSAQESNLHLARGLLRCLHYRVCQTGHRRHVLEHCFAKPVRALWKEV